MNSYSAISYFDFKLIVLCLIRMINSVILDKDKVITKANKDDEMKLKSAKIQNYRLLKNVNLNPF